MDVEDIIDNYYILTRYKRAAKETEIYYSFYENRIKGYLFGLLEDEVIDIYKRIKPCSCGCKRPKGMQKVNLGEYLFKITCPKCGKSFSKNSSDLDLSRQEDEIDFCINEWNMNNERVEKVC